MFVAPTVFIGLGRWGNAVCDTFFREVLSTLSPTRSRAIPQGAPTALPACFSRLAWVRDMDRETASIGWAGEIQSWPAKLDATDPERFSDVTGSDSLVSFWSTPRECFRSSLGEQWKLLEPVFKKLLDRVTSMTWRDGCDALGLQVPSELESTDKWIVTVGSLFEPEVGIVIADLERFVQDNLRAGESGYKFLHLVDLGIPPDPEQPNDNWVTCPASLQTQLLASFQELQATPERSICFYTSSTNRSGFRVSVAARMACAVGVLRCYFTGSLLSPAERTSRLPSVFKHRHDPIAVTPDRTAVFLEFALDLDNLPELIARELLARWKRATFLDDAPLADFEELKALFEQRLSPTPSAGRGIFEDLVNKWFHLGLNPTQIESLETFKNWIEGNKAIWIESMHRDEVPSLQAPLEAKRSLWNRIKTFLGVTGPPTVAPSVSRGASLRQRVEFSDEVLSALTTVADVLQEIATPESVFQDVRYDEHLMITAMSASVLLAEYKRLPLDADCPPVIREFLSKTDSAVPGMILDAMHSPEQVVPIVCRGLAGRWRAETNGEKAEDRWESRGIAQWMRADVALASQVASYASRTLIPLWRPNSYAAGNWGGFLTVFEFGVGPDSAPSRDSADALEAIRKQFGRLGLETTFALGAAREKCLAAFQTDVCWERWPSLQSIGLLWTDTARHGMGLGEDWDKQEFMSFADEWKDLHPAEARWINPSEATGTKPRTGVGN